METDKNCFYLESSNTWVPALSYTVIVSTRWSYKAKSLTYWEYYSILEVFQLRTQFQDAKNFKGQVLNS